MAGSSGSTPNLADTFGWDSVFALRMSDVNKAIVSANTSPSGFSGTVQNTPANILVKGTFGAWRLIEGGDGQDLHMGLPIPIVHYNDGSGEKTFTGGLAKIEVQLTALPQPTTPAGTWIDLKIRSSAKQPVAGSQATASDPVSVIDLCFSGKPQPDVMQQAAIETALGDWLSGNLQAFNQTFASVNLAAKAAVGPLQWLMPTTVSYAVTDLGTLDTGVFGVLCMTEGRNASGLAHQVSPWAIPKTGGAGLLISPERFLSKLLMPGIGVLFSGPVTPVAGKKWPDDYFAIDATQQTITNLADIQIAKFQLDGATYVADLPKGNLTVTLENTYLETQLLNLHHKLDARVYKLNVPVPWFDVYHRISVRTTTCLTDQVIDLLPLSGTQTALVTETDTAQKIQMGLLVASIAATAVGAVAFLLPKALGTAATASDIAADGTSATITATSTLDVVPTAAQAEELTADAAPSALAVIRTGLVQAADFMTAWGVCWRASLIAGLAGAPALFDLALGAFEDRKFQTMPHFQDFAASMMTPVVWPWAKSDFVVTDVKFNLALQIAGTPAQAK